MICPDCHSRIDDDAEQCPECGMYILDSELYDDQSAYAPATFAIVSVLFGLVSISVWGPVVMGDAQGFIPLTLITPLIGYGFGVKGRLSGWKKTAWVGIGINLAAIAMALIFVAVRIGTDHSPIWLN